MDTSQERLRILDMIDSGRITAEQGMQLLRALNESSQNEPDVEVDDASSYDTFPEDASNGSTSLNVSTLPLPGGNRVYAPDLQPAAPTYPLPGVSSDVRSPGFESAETIESLSQRAARLKGLWVYPLWAGVIIAALSGLFMIVALQRNQGAIGLLFLCAAVPAALGLFVMLLAWFSRSAPWLHLRVQQAPGETPQRISLSFPLPARSGAWFVRVFGGFIPGLRDRPVENLLYMVQQTAETGEPIHIEVDEGEAGEKVEIFIG